MGVFVFIHSIDFFSGSIPAKYCGVPEMPKAMYMSGWGEDPAYLIVFLVLDSQVALNLSYMLLAMVMLASPALPEQVV